MSIAERVAMERGEKIVGQTGERISEFRLIGQTVGDQTAGEARHEII